MTALILLWYEVSVQAAVALLATSSVSCGAPQLTVKDNCTAHKKTQETVQWQQTVVPPVFLEVPSYSDYILQIFSRWSWKNVAEIWMWHCVFFRKLPTWAATNMSSKNVVFKKICKDKSVSKATRFHFVNFTHLNLTLPLPASLFPGVGPHRWSCSGALSCSLPLSSDGASLLWLLLTFSNIFMSLDTKLLEITDWR